MVAVVQLNAPPMNLFSIDTVDALMEELPKLRDDFAVRCIVIKGGPVHFSGGANLRQIMGGIAKDAMPKVRRCVWSFDGSVPGRCQ